MSDVVIRLAVPDDSPTILAFIRELAEYEKLLHEVVADEASIRTTLFGPRPAAEVLIGELVPEGRIEPASSHMLTPGTISLREEPESITKKVRTMPTDPARVKRTDPGEPEKCPVWQLHLVYSDDKTKEWVQHGCRSAGIGCLECKQPVIDAVVAELRPIRERAQRYLEDPTLVRNIMAEGAENADKLAQETLRDVRQAMGLDYA